MNKKMRVSTIVLENYQQLIAIFQKYSISQVRIFGSVARLEDHESSDIDFLIKLPENSTLLDYGQLRYELEKLLNTPMDILTFSGLNPMVVEHFCKNSIALEELPHLTHARAIQERMTDSDRVIKNLKSAVWVIDRILKCCVNIDKDEFMNQEMIQDAVTRNIQLLGQVISQIPEKEIEKLDTINVDYLKGAITLRDALFMNVDYILLWNTICNELPILKENIQEFILENS